MINRRYWYSGDSEEEPYFIGSLIYSIDLYGDKSKNDKKNVSTNFILQTNNQSYADAQTDDTHSQTHTLSISFW